MKILIDNGHGVDTLGKRSPDGLFREYKWTRQIAAAIVAELNAKGYDAEILVPEENDISLKERCNRVNKICNLLGKNNVVLISIHTNAAGDGSKWLNARGWSAYTTKGVTKSDKLADLLYKYAETHLQGQKIRKDFSDGDPDWEENFYILKNTNCPAVLTENFFQDNKEDVSYLLSFEGQSQIIKTHIDALVEYVNG